MSVASSNQNVLDYCETIVIAVKPQVASKVASQLRFRPEHHVISVVSGLSLQAASKLVAPATRVTRAVPLPSTAKRIGPTGIYPPDPVVVGLFAAIGTVFAVESEGEFEAICAATATIASYYAFVAEIASWMSRHGFPEAKALDYVARMFYGVASAAVDARERSFRSLAAAHATVGGINEQFLQHLAESGLTERVSDGLDAVMRRIKASTQRSSGD